MEDEGDDLWDKVKQVAGVFPPAAFAFVASGLAHTVRSVHGDLLTDDLEMYSAPETSDPQDTERACDDESDLDQNKNHGKGDDKDHLEGDGQSSGAAKRAAGRVRHVNGQQLCAGLRDYAIKRYGKMARLVLQHMNIHETDDFGRIVFAMIEAKQMSRSEGDKFEDFCNVFSFDDAFGGPH